MPPGSGGGASASAGTVMGAPAAPTRPLDPLLARLLARLVRALDVSDEEHLALSTLYRAWRDEAVAAPLRALVEAADEAERRYEAMFGDSARRDDRPRGAATYPRGGDPHARAEDLIRANTVYESTLGRAIRAQRYMCDTGSCQFEATVLANGKAYCSFACHTANALARATGPTVRFAPTGSAFAQSAAPTPTPAPSPTPASSPTLRARAAWPADIGAGANGGTSATAEANTAPVLRSREPEARLLGAGNIPLFASNMRAPNATAGVSTN